MSTSLKITGGSLRQGCPVAYAKVESRRNITSVVSFGGVRVAIQAFPPASVATPPPTINVGASGSVDGSPFCHVNTLRTLSLPSSSVMPAPQLPNHFALLAPILTLKKL